MKPTPQSALALLAALFPDSCQQTLDLYKEIVRANDWYKPRSWLQAMFYIAAGGTKTKTHKLE